MRLTAGSWRRRPTWRVALALACALGVVFFATSSSPATGAAGLSSTTSGQELKARIVGRSAARVLRRRRVRVRLSGPRGLRVRVILTFGATGLRSARGFSAVPGAATKPRSTVLNSRGRARITLRLDRLGRRELRVALRTCRPVAVMIHLLGGQREGATGDELKISRRCAQGVTPGLPSTPGGGSTGGGGGGGGPGGAPAKFRVGAAVADFSPPLAGHAPGGDRASCDPTGVFSGARKFAFEEPYLDLNGKGHYQGPLDPTSLIGFPPALPPNPTTVLGDPYLDCNANGRWEGNLIGGGGAPRFYDQVVDPVTARATVVANGQQTIAVEVVDQEGLFNVYQQQIRDKVAADGFRLDNVFISATHDESAPDSLGLGGVNSITSGTNNYFVAYLVEKSAKAIEQAYQAMRPATIRYTEALEPSNLRQCWSSYPFVDDQRIPVLQALGTDGKPIVTLASVSQHAETLAFNGGSALDNGTSLDAEKRWVSSDWPNFFRSTLEQRYGGVAIEMAGSVGSVESPEVYSSSISRTPQKEIGASHPAGCRTLFQVNGQSDQSGSGHVPLGYSGETQAFGQQMAGAVSQALDTSASASTSNDIWGRRADACVPLENALFAAAATAGVFANRPGYSSDCSVKFPVAPNGSTSGQAVLSQVAAFRIGDGEFISIPGEVFPFTFLRGFQGPQDMQTPSDPLPPWLIPHMHTPYRFIDGLGEDMLGYIFPQGNAVGIPSTSNPGAINSDTDRFGCNHSDDSEAASSMAADVIGNKLVGLLDNQGGPPEKIVTGRYILPGGTLSRDPLGGPELKCNVDNVFHPAGPAVGVKLADGTFASVASWMSLSGRPQRTPDRDTRGYFDPSGQRVWLDVFPNVNP